MRKKYCGQKMLMWKGEGRRLGGEASYVECKSEVHTFTWGGPSHVKQGTLWQYRIQSGGSHITSISCPVTRAQAHAPYPLARETHIFFSQSGTVERFLDQLEVRALGSEY
jgi:hypothetical protein